MEGVVSAVFVVVILVGLFELGSRFARKQIQRYDEAMSHPAAREFKGVIGVQVRMIESALLLKGAAKCQVDLRRAVANQLQARNLPDVVVVTGDLWVEHDRRSVPSVYVDGQFDRGASLTWTLTFSQFGTEDLIVRWWVTLDEYGGGLDSWALWFLVLGGYGWFFLAGYILSMKRRGLQWRKRSGYDEVAMERYRSAVAIVVDDVIRDAIDGIDLGGDAVRELSSLPGMLPNAL